MYRILSIFLLITIGSFFSGCAPKTNSPDINVEPHMLTGAWQVEDIDQGGIIDFAMVTIQFEDENRISGFTGCNQFNGAINTLSGTFIASQVASTRRACAPAISGQEQRFLAALNDAVRYEIVENTWLVVYDASGKPRLKLIYMEPQPINTKT